MIILDTNALIWLTTAKDKLSRKARNTIEKAVKESGLLVSSISIWEAYLLVKKNRLKFMVDIDTWLEKLENTPYLRFVPVDNQIAAKSVKLSDFDSNDPADRMVIATALQYGAVLITSDKKILDYKQIQTIW